MNYFAPRKTSNLLQSEKGKVINKGRSSAQIQKTKEEQRDQVINHYNLGNNITIKNLNNISIENIMLPSSSSIDSKQSYEPVLMTEPNEDYRRRKYNNDKDSNKKRVFKGKNSIISDNNYNNIKNKERNLSGENKEGGVNKMISILRDEFNEITLKHVIQRRDTIQKKNDNDNEEDIDINLKSCIKDNDYKGEQSLSSIKSFNEQNEKMRLNNSNNHNNQTKSNNIKRTLLSRNTNNSNADYKLFYNPTSNTMISPQQINLNKKKKDIQCYYKQRINNSLSFNNSILPNDPYVNANTNNIIASNYLNTCYGNACYNFNCINKQITFSIRSSRNSHSHLYQNSDLIIKQLQAKIDELQLSIKILQEYISSQQNVFITHCQTIIAKQIEKQENYKILKEREMTTHLIKENTIYKKLIQTIIFQLCKVIANESYQQRKDNHLITQILKENEYLREMNISVNHILTSNSFENEVNDTSSINFPQKKRSFSNCKRKKNDSSLLASGKEHKSRNLLSSSSIANKNLEETIKKLAQCQSVNEIEKITLSKTK